ncbi:MAG: class I SAM-dependent methyltransferase [Cyanobacteria bacterium P01_F01_bin.86]
MKIYSSEWAENYERLAHAGIPGREGLYRICQAVFQPVPSNACLLVVGCGTGVELLHLAKAFPTASFVAVDPAQPMLEFCAQRVKEEKLSERISLHLGELDSLPSTSSFDAATAILVSQHIREDEKAEAFFKSIAERLKPNGYLYSADLHIATGQNRERMISLWQQQALMSGIDADIIQETLGKFEKDFRVRDEALLTHLLASAGLTFMLKPFSSLLYGAWCSVKG